MEQLIKNLKLTKENTQIEIEQLLLNTQDFSQNYYLIKRMNTNSYAEAAEKIYKELQSN